MRRSLRILPGLLLLLAACGDDASGPGGARITVAPDEVQPFTEALPAWDEGEPERPVAALREGDRQTAFIENEILVGTDDEAALEALLERWNGVVVASFDPSELGLDDVATRHVVRIDPEPGAVGAETLATDLAALAPGFDGEVAFSSEEGLRSLAVVAAESLEGIEVDANWIARPDDFADYETEEAPQGMGYRDAFSMKHLREGGAQDTGVVEAWIALERAGRLDERVRLGVIDGGFSENRDTTFGRSWSHVSVGSAADIGTRNPTQCSGGSSCPWHGTSVVHAAAGRADNRFGSAGPAGPVADVDMRHSPLDNGSVEQALATLGGADVVNMSFSGDVSTTWQFAIDGYRSFVQGIGEHQLLFAAAGNDGDDLDDHRVTFPCEFHYVICVGALGDGTADAASYSNYGSLVDIWAPGTNLLLGPDPSTGATQTRRRNGTSFSSPFAAGVAALLLAADSSLSRDDVEARLLSTAHTSSSDPEVESWVDARAAVLSVLPDSPPQVYIEEPMDDATFDEGATVGYRATVDDLDDDPSGTTIYWSHTTDDVLYSMGSSVAGDVFEDSSLCEGTYVVDAEVDGGIADSVTLHFDPLPDSSAPPRCAPPPDEVVIDSPSDGATIPEGDTFALRATVHPVPPASPVIWRDGGPSGRILGMGTTSSTRLSAGTHTLWVGYGDASDTVTVDVVSTANTAPTISITSPPDGEFINDYSSPPTASVDFTANATDSEDGTLGGGSVAWYYRKEGTSGWIRATPTGSSVTIDLLDDMCRGTGYDIKAVATDSGGLTGEDIISIAVNTFGC